MQQFNAEQRGKGCAVLVNLGVSVVLLILLLWILLPGLFEVPQWVKTLKTNLGQSTRLILSPVFLAPDLQSPGRNKQLIVNTYTSDKEVLKFLKKKNAANQKPVLLTFQDAGSFEVFWEKEFPEMNARPRHPAFVHFDQSNCYFKYHNWLRSLNTYTGDENWAIQYTFRSSLPEEAPVVFSNEFAFFLGSEGKLVSLQLKTGRIVWTKEGYSTGRGLRLFGNKITVLYQKKDASFALCLFDFNGNLRDEIALGTSKILFYTYHKDEFIVLQQDAFNKYVIKTIHIYSKKISWALYPDRLIKSPTSSAFVSAAIFPSLEEQLLFICNESTQSFLLKISGENGKASVLWQQNDKLLTRLDYRNEYLLCKASTPKSSFRDEIWLIDTFRGKILWKTKLKSSLIQQNNGLEWSARITGNNVYVFQLLEGEDNLLIEKFVLKSGLLIDSFVFKVRKEECAGFHWKSDKLYLSIGNLYAFDFKTGKLLKEWP